MTPGIQELIRQNERVWDGFLRALLVAHDVDAALAVTAAQITLVNLPMRTGGTDREGLRRYLADDLLPHLPAGLSVRRLTRTADRLRVVDELAVGFTHDRELPWLLPGVPATQRPVEGLAVAVVTFRQGRIAGVRTVWDLGGPGPASGGDER